MEKVRGSQIVDIFKDSVIRICGQTALHVRCEGKRVKNYFKVFDLSNWKDGVVN